MEDAATPGLVDRVDHLTAAVADLAFKLETLISSTTAFRESFGERMTDYADLVAHWSIEAEQNLADQRRLTENVSAAVAKVERRLLEAIEGVASDVNQADALAAVLAEVTATRRELPVVPPFPEIPALDLTPLAEQVQRLREELPDIVATVSPTADLTPLAEEVRGLRRDVVRLPDDRQDIGELRDALAAVLGEVTAARTEQPEPVDVTPIAAEVRQLREALLAEASSSSCCGPRWRPCRRGWPSGLRSRSRWRR
jgi:hypothetical protein